MAGHLSFPLIFSDVSSGGSGLPAGGTDGQILLSDGAGSGTWADGAVGRTKVVSVPFAFDTPDLLTGAVIYTPTVGELLLEAWIEVVTQWDGATPLADIGTFLNGSTSGLFRRADSAIPADTFDSDADNPGVRTGTNSSNLSLAEKSVYGDSVRSAPAKFVEAYPLCVIVTQEGTPGGTSPGAGQGAAIVHLVIWSPDEVGGVTGGLSVTDGSATVSPVASLTVMGAIVGGSAGNATIAVGNAWDAAATYPVGAVVIDRGGTWQCLIANTNSQPISGNVNWALIGGLPYVEIVLDPVALTSAPWYDALGVGPGVVGIPAPGAGKVLNVPFIMSATSTGDAWGTLSNTQCSFTSPATGLASVQVSSIPDTLADVIGAGGDTWKLSAFAGLESSIGADLTTINQSYVIWNNADLKSGGIGTRSLFYRIYYTIEPASYSGFSSFFTITGLDQGSKTFTVTGDAHTLTGSIAVVGSTGNDATYTIVSATFTTDHTDIVVTEAIASATADGWVKQ